MVTRAQRGTVLAVRTLERLGRPVLIMLAAVGDITLLQFRVLRALVVQPQRRRTIVLQFYRIGYLSLPVVVLTGLSTGMVLAVQAYATLVKVSGETMTGAMTTFALVAELGPTLTGLMLAGRVGAAIAAELGSMKVTEQIDALRVMGTDPIAYLVAPRFLACVTLLPVLAAICAGVGVWAADLLATVVWQLDQGAYWAKVVEHVQLWDIATGLAKATFFGAVIALVACRRGLRTQGGAAGVGAACTEGVVVASILILVSNFVLTLLFRQAWRLLA